MMKLSDKIEISEILTPLDWGIFLTVLLLTFLTVLYGHGRKRKRQEKGEDQEESILDLLLMGRQLTLPLFVATLVATWYGGIFGVTQIAYEKGIYNFVTQGFCWYFTYFIFAFFLVQRIRSYDALTLPDLMGKLFGPKSKVLSAVFNFFNMVPIAYAISLGLFLQTLLGGSLFPMTLLGVLVVCSYSLLGGFRAVVFSDVVQFLVMCSGVFLVVAFSVTTFGGFSFLKTSLPASYFTLTGGESFLATFVWALIALSTLVDPNFYQRCFAARSTQVARRGILISIFIWVGFDICTTAGGMYARALLPKADSQTAYLTYALQILPEGVRGFFLAGVFTTVFSTLDSYCFLAGTTITWDLLPSRWREKTWSHYVGVFSVGLLASCLAVSFEGNIKMVWKTLGSYSASCLFMPAMAGFLFPKKISDHQFVLSCLAGVVATTYWRFTLHSGIWKNIDELYIGMFVTGMGLCLTHVFRIGARSQKGAA